MAERVRITEVGPRDGLQNEPGIIPTAEKVRLVELCCATGVDEVEVTSFVSPKWVPQLGDAAEVLSEVSARLPFPEGRGRGKGSWGERSREWYPGLGKGGWQSTRTYTVPPLDRVTQLRAKALRNAMTGPEWALWNVVKSKQLAGYKFRRQHPFGPFILDFFCPAVGLVVELDGITHGGEVARERDAARTAYLERHGLKVIRFSDDAAVKSIEFVYERISRTVFEMDAARSGMGVGSMSPRAPEPFPRPLPSGKGSGRPILAALVPNEKGMEAVEALNRAALGRVVDKIAVFTAASETFNKKNTNATIEESLERFGPVIDRAHEAGLEVRGYISCAIACPFEGPIAPERVAAVAWALAVAGVDEFDLGDTIGAATPATLTAMLKATMVALGDERASPFVTLHLHDTFGRAAECVKAALDMGVRSFDGSVAGLGGCPYASVPGKRAPGNISTETLVRTVHAAGFETGVDLDKLSVAAEYAREIVGRARANGGAA
jgi:hydroxymethylglutaryl-CoA lyase